VESGSTPLLRHDFDAGRKSRIAAEPGREAYLLSRIPLGRFATPEDITGTILFLASHASDFVTGETIFVDGGWRTSK